MLGRFVPLITKSLLLPDENGKARRCETRKRGYTRNHVFYPLQVAWVRKLAKCKTKREGDRESQAGKQTDKGESHRTDRQINTGRQRREAENKQAGRQIDIQTYKGERQITDRQIERHTDRQRRERTGGQVDRQSKERDRTARQIDRQ